MTITDTASKALAAVLREEVLSASTIDEGISASINDVFDNRVIVIGNDASLRHPFVPGKYDVRGEVVIQQSVDTEDAENLFRTLCEEVRTSLENKDTLPDRIAGQHPGFLVYTFIFQDQTASPSKRGFQAAYQWEIFAELPN